MVIMENATEQNLRRAAEGLWPLDKRSGALFEDFPLSVQILSPDGHTLQVNRAWETLFGLTLDDLRGYKILADPQLRDTGVLPLLQWSCPSA